MTPAPATPRRPRQRRHPDPSAEGAGRPPSTSAPSRAAARPSCRPAGVPETPLERADPREPAARRSPRSSPRSPSPRSSATTTGISRRNFDLDTGPYPLGSCTMKHNPRLNERVAALPGHARLHPAQDPKRAQGALELMWRPRARAGGDHRAAARLAAALGRLARRARGPAAHPRLPRRPRRGAHEGAHPRHRARHQPGDGDDGGLRGREGGDRRRGRGRPRRPARQGRRRRRLPDAHQPQHARALRPQHRRDRRRSSTGWAAPSTTTAPTSTRSWAAPGRATWASTSST